MLTRRLPSFCRHQRIRGCQGSPHPNPHHPERKRGMKRVTQFSEDRLYRYTLWREWAIEDLLCKAERSAEVPAHHYLMVIGLNPSTADETKDDPTIRKCIGFAKRWGFGALCMTNLFAWRATKPKDMKMAPDPVGIDNNLHLVSCAHGAGMILAAWGKDGNLNNRCDEIFRDVLTPNFEVYCLKKNNDGSPIHPLYVPYEQTPSIL